MRFESWYSDFEMFRRLHTPGAFKVGQNFKKHTVWGNKSQSSDTKMGCAFACVYSAMWLLTQLVFLRSPPVDMHWQRKKKKKTFYSCNTFLFKVFRGVNIEGWKYSATIKAKIHPGASQSCVVCLIPTLTKVERQRMEIIARAKPNEAFFFGFVIPAIT